MTAASPFGVNSSRSAKNLSSNVESSERAVRHLRENSRACSLITGLRGLGRGFVPG